MAYLGLADANKNIGEHRIAREYYEKALKIAQERGDKFKEREAYLELQNAQMPGDKGKVCSSEFGKYSWSTLWGVQPGCILEPGPAGLCWKGRRWANTVEKWERT